VLWPAGARVCGSAASKPSGYGRVLADYGLRESVDVRTAVIR
jgi:hypothetical protein